MLALYYPVGPPARAMKVAIVALVYFWRSHGFFQGRKKQIIDVLDPRGRCQHAMLISLPAPDTFFLTYYLFSFVRVESPFQRNIKFQ